MYDAVKIDISSGIIVLIVRTMDTYSIMKTIIDGITILNVIIIKGMIEYAIIFLKANQQKL
jgi:hypothetical protein